MTTGPPGTPPPAPLAPLPAPLADPFGPGAAAVLVALTSTCGGVDVVVDRPGGGVGTVAIDHAACTGCGTCAAACPTRALEAVDLSGRRSISFDAARCVACGVCVSVCPEIERGAISLRPAADVARLGQGRTTLFDSELVRCRSCVAPVAPAALLARIGALVGDERVLAAVSDKCLDCRGMGPMG